MKQMVQMKSTLSQPLNCPTNPDHLSLTSLNVYKYSNPFSQEVIYFFLLIWINVKLNKFTFKLIIFNIEFLE